MVSGKPVLLPALPAGEVVCRAVTCGYLDRRVGAERDGIPHPLTLRVLADDATSSTKHSAREALL